MPRPLAVAVCCAVIAGACPDAGAAAHPAAHATPGTGHYAEVAGYRLYYEEYGHGRPLVLLHGGLSTIKDSFARQIPAFARERKVVAIEQVGHGHTPDARPTFTYDQMADDTADLLRQLELGAADFVGWSDGGVIALVIARRHPELVRRLVVSGTNVTVEGQRPENIQALRDATEGSDATDVVSKVQRLWLTPVVLDKDDLAQITAPVLLVSGDRDAIRLEHTVEIFEALPHAQLCILPGTGHDTFQAAAPTLNPLILRFLAGS